MNLVNVQRIFLQAVLILAIMDCIQLADTVSCTSVIDGDTIRLDTGETVRLIGIDAPELSQSGGRNVSSIFGSNGPGKKNLFGQRVRRQRQIQ